MKYFDCRHEILAVSMAMGYTEVTHRLPAVLLHAGVGPLHAAMAMRTAYMSQNPMLICSGESTDHSGQEVRAPGGHWISVLADMGGPSTLVKPYVKWSNAVKSRDTLMDAVYRGCQIALTPPKGPVFLSISRELMLKSMPGIDVNQKRSLKTEFPEPNRPDLKEIAGQLMASQNPIIITEYAGRSPQATGKLTELAELLSIPVFECNHPFFTNIDRKHPLYMGSDAKEALEKADIVFVVGSAIPWYPPLASPPNAKTILLDESTAHEKLPYWGYQFDLTLATDIEKGLNALVDIIRANLKKPGKSESEYQERFKYWQDKHNEMVKQWETEALSGKKNSPVSSKWFFYTLRQILPEDSIILNESILHTRFIERYLAKVGRYTRLGFGALGTGLGQAAGVKLASPDRPVVFFVGDGGFNYNPVPAALGLCQQYKLPILVIVLNNCGYMAMKEDHNKSYPQGWAACHNEYLGVNIAPQPDYAKLAEAFGGYGERYRKAR